MTPGSRKQPTVGDSKEGVDLAGIWTAYGTAVRAFLHSRIANPTDVEDVLQDILIKTHSGLGDVRSNDRLKSWIMQIANRSIIDFYRRQGRTRPDSLSEESWSEIPESEPGHALANCLVPFLNALPEESAGIIRAIDLEGHSQRDYATAHSIPYSTLKSRVQKARLQLRAVVKACCHLSLDRRGKVIDYEARSSNCVVCSDEEADP